MLITKNFNILTIDLSALHNYFGKPNKIIFRSLSLSLSLPLSFSLSLYVAKFLHFKKQRCLIFIVLMLILTLI